MSRIFFINSLQPQASPYLLSGLSFSRLSIDIFRFYFHKYVSPYLIFLLSSHFLLTPCLSLSLFSLSIHPELVKQTENTLWCGSMFPCPMVCLCAFVREGFQVFPSRLCGDNGQGWRGVGIGLLSHSHRHTPKCTHIKELRARRKTKRRPLNNW